MPILQSRTLFCLLLLAIGLSACDTSNIRSTTASINPVPAVEVTVTATATERPGDLTPALDLTLGESTEHSEATAEPTLSAEIGHPYFLLGGRGPIWMLDAAGNQRDFSVVDDAPGYAVFSPDGRRVAYVTNADDWRSQLVIANADGGEAVALTFVTDQLVLMPAWSPDGSRIVFSADFRTMGQNPDLYVVDVAAALAAVSAGGTPVATPLVEAPGFDLAPAWSPDGRDIAFSSTGPTGNETDIYVVAAEGGEPRRAITLDGDEGEPAWSPDGDQLAFVTYADEDRGRLAVLPSAQFGGAEQMPHYINHPGTARSPVWTADGRLVFLADRQLFSADSAGALTQLAADTVNATHVDWQWVPDGALPALAGTGNFLLQTPYPIVATPDGVFAFNGDGSGMIRILPRAFTPSASALSPDGAQLAVAGCCLVDSDVPTLLVVETTTLDWRVSTPLLAARPLLSDDDACAANGSDSLCQAPIAVDRIIWSPDGSQIALSGTQSAEDHTSAALWLVQEGGAGAELIHAGRGEHLTFSADSERLYFLGYAQGEVNLFVANAPSYEPLRVTGDAFAGGVPEETALHIVPGRP